MTPEFASVMRRRLPRIILAVLLVVLAYLGWKIAYGGGIHIPPLVDAIETVVEDVTPEPPPPVEEVLPEPMWLYVQANNVLFWPVVDDQCQNRNALMQVHQGEKVLVIMDHDGMIEVELNNQSLPHTHGCIHHSLLGPEQ